MTTSSLSHCLVSFPVLLLCRLILQYLILHYSFRFFVVWHTHCVAFIELSHNTWQWHDIIIVQLHSTFILSYYYNHVVCLCTVFFITVVLVFTGPFFRFSISQGHKWWVRILRFAFDSRPRGSTYGWRYQSYTQAFKRGRWLRYYPVLHFLSHIARTPCKSCFVLANLAMVILIISSQISHCFFILHYQSTTAIPLANPPAVSFLPTPDHSTLYSGVPTPLLSTPRCPLSCLVLLLSHC